MGSEYKKHLHPIMTRFNDAVNYYNESSNSELDDVLTLQLNSINNSITKLSKSYRTKDYNVFKYLNISIKGVFPIAGAFKYIYDQNNQECSLTFFPEVESGKTHFIFTVSNQEHKYLSFLNLKNDKEIATYISNIIISAGSNVFLSLSYWDMLPNDIKEFVLQNKKEQLVSYNFNLFNTTLQSD